MDFDTAPRLLEALELSTSETMLLAVLVPLTIAIVIGLERELALFAATAGVIAALLAGTV